MWDGNQAFDVEYVTRIVVRQDKSSDKYYYEFQVRNSVGYPANKQPLRSSHLRIVDLLKGLLIIV